MLATIHLLFFFRLLSKNVKIKSQKTTTLPVRWEAMDWNDLAQVREQWRALVNRVMKFRVWLKTESSGMLW
jgi:hypothetical protein